MRRKMIWNKKKGKEKGEKRVRRKKIVFKGKKINSKDWRRN